MKKLLSLLAALTVAGCATLTGPDWIYAYRAERMHPEGWYEWAYDEMAACAGVYFTGLPEGKSYRDIEWFMVPADSMTRPNGALAVGMFSAPDRIFIDERWVMEAYVIYHEIGHYITNIDHRTPDAWAVLETKCVLPLSAQ